jgi:hypothetical protein
VGLQNNKLTKQRSIKLDGMMKEQVDQICWDNERPYGQISQLMKEQVSKTTS